MDSNPRIPGFGAQTKRRSVSRESTRGPKRERHPHIEKIDYAQDHLVYEEHSRAQFMSYLS